ncbi:heterokaryon incompatibility protein-domain-containing protein [Xylariaceae sp. FL0804]|nr:heterokaryon incompatibility protein-domain-containing protein [Xylariaceae sp. FL0804]
MRYLPVGVGDLVGAWHCPKEYYRYRWFRRGSLTESVLRLQWLCGLIYDRLPAWCEGPPSSIVITCGEMIPVPGSQGTPAASRLRRERWTTADRNPDYQLQWAAECLASCRRDHEACGDDRDYVEMPTRVVDVGSPTEGRPLHLAIPAADGLREPYAALSYCWGAGAQHTTELRESNLALLRDGIDEARLTQTHREALAVTRALGLRYLWIDSLCINRGDPADWAAESRRMGRVYGGAALTIIAGRASDSRHGFVANTLQPAAGPCALPYHSSTGSSQEAHGDGDGNGNRDRHRLVEPRTDHDVAYACLRRSHDIGPTDDRGWCFQEAALSRRVLLFGREQLLFQCQQVHAWEDGDFSRRGEDTKLGSRLRRNLAVPIGLGNGRRAAVPARGTKQGQGQEQAQADEDDDDRGEAGTRDKLVLLRQWYSDVVMPYSRRRLTDPHDVFAAMMSLAQLARPRLGSRYLAGLWECDMVRGLLWRPRHIAQMSRTFPPVVRPIYADPLRPELVGRQAARAPSWSWAAVQGPVYASYLERDEARYRDPAHVVVRPLATTPPASGIGSGDAGRVGGGGEGGSEGRGRGEAAPTTPATAAAAWTRAAECHADEVHVPACELAFLGRPQRVRVVPAGSEAAASGSRLYRAFHRFAAAPRRLVATGQLVLLLPPLPDPEQGQEQEQAGERDEPEVVVGNDDKGKGAAAGAMQAVVVAVGCFDVAGEIDAVATSSSAGYWALALTRDEGLLLRRDATDGPFRRLGVVSVMERAWMLAGPEREVSLV